MAEKQKSMVGSHEKVIDNGELEQTAERRSEAIRDELERAEQAHKEHLSEASALAEAKKLAHDKEKNSTMHEPSPAERRRGGFTKKQLENAYDSQMKHARDQMSPSARVFSKLIHSRPVEGTSDAIGSTLARPNALLSGSITAFLTITILYFTAKYYGFQLSGFETIAAFIIGWIIGILYDYFSVMIRGKKN